MITVALVTVENLVIRAALNGRMRHFVIEQLAELHDHVGELDVRDVLVFVDGVRDLIEGFRVGTQRITVPCADSAGYGRFLHAICV